MSRECAVPLHDLRGNSIGWVHLSALSGELSLELHNLISVGDDDRLVLDWDMKLKTADQIQEEEDNGTRPS